MKNIKKHAHKNRYTNTCLQYHISTTDKGLACKKKNNSELKNITPVLEHPNIKTRNGFIHESLTHAFVMAGTAM